MATIIYMANTLRNVSPFSRGLNLPGLQLRLDKPANAALDRLAALTYDELFLKTKQAAVCGFSGKYILTGKDVLAGFINKQTP